MKIKKISDLKLRGLFLKQERSLKMYKFLFINFSFSKCNLLKKAGFFLATTKLYGSSFIKSSRTKFNNRCILTNRSRGVIRRYGLSRVKFRELLAYNILPGYKKAVW